jgi:restriction system protein
MTSEKQPDDRAAEPPEPLPPGTASALAAAAQPPPPRRNYVDSPNRMLFMSSVQAQQGTWAQFMASDQAHIAQLYGTSYSRTVGVAHLTAVQADPNIALPDAALLLQTVIERGEKTKEGELIVSVTLPWFEIIAAISKDPSVVHQLKDRQWEEMIAGIYHRAKFDEVILTPRSGDAGRDVIATKRGVGTIRIIDQVKAYRPGHLVTADDVRALYGVVAADPKVSKGFLTTTSDFAPRLRNDPLMGPLIGSRLELVNGTELLARLKELGKL